MSLTTRSKKSRQNIALYAGWVVMGFYVLLCFLAVARGGQIFPQSKAGPDSAVSNGSQGWTRSQSQRGIALGPA